MSRDWGPGRAFVSFPRQMGIMAKLRSVMLDHFAERLAENLEERLETKLERLVDEAERAGAMQERVARLSRDLDDSDRRFAQRESAWREERETLRTQLRGYMGGSIADAEFLWRRVERLEAEHGLLPGEDRSPLTIMTKPERI